MEVNTALLRKTLEGELDKKVLPLLKARMTRRFVAAKKDMLEEFDNHEVTRELETGPNAPSSRFLPKGNLFAFLGFYEDDKPIEPLRYQLDSETKIVNFEKVQHRNDTYSVAMRTQVPTLTEINKRHQLNWIDKGWVDAVENGLLGLPMFIFGLFTKGNSRSTTGLEVKNNVREEDFAGVPGKYLTPILRKYKQDIRGAKI